MSTSVRAGIHPQPKIEGASIHQLKPNMAGTLKACNVLVQDRLLDHITSYQQYLHRLQMDMNRDLENSVIEILDNACIIKAEDKHIHHHKIKELFKAQSCLLDTIYNKSNIIFQELTKTCAFLQQKAFEYHHTSSDNLKKRKFESDSESANERMNEKRRRKRRKRGKQRKDSVHSSGDESDNDSDIHMNNLSNISQRLDRMERGIESVDQAIKSMSERKKKKTKRKTKKTTRERKKTNTNEKYPRSVILNGEKWNRSHSKEEKRYFWTDSCRKASWNPWNEIAKINAPWITSKQKYSKFKDDKGKPYWYDYENGKATYKKPKGYDSSDEILYDSDASAGSAPSDTL
eukprot:188224_1